MLAWLLALLLLGCQGAPTGDSDRVRVAVSIPPLADFVRQVGGGHVQVEELVPPGSSVHTYEPKPRQIEFVSRASLLVLNGVGLEFWAGDVSDAAHNPKLIVVDTSQGIDILAAEEHEEGGNPHIWLDPQNAIVQVEHIRDALIQTDPSHTADYQANAARFVAQLQALDGEIQAEVATWSHREFISFHAAFVYFARRYGLIQAAVLEEFPGKEPTPDYLAEVVDTARRVGGRAIFAEPQFSPKIAETVAREAGKEVLILDPLGGVQGRETYLELMRYNLAEMAKGLK